VTLEGLKGGIRGKVQLVPEPIEIEKLNAHSAVTAQKNTTGRRQKSAAMFALSVKQKKRRGRVEHTTGRKVRGERGHGLAQGGRGKN